MCRAGDRRQRAQRRRREHVETIGNAFVVAIGGKEVLRQIVRADREEIDLGADRIELKE